MTDPQTPATEAGRRLLDLLADRYTLVIRSDFVRLTRAIEAEARAEALREAAERVRALPSYPMDTLVPNTGPDVVRRDDLWTILDPEVS